MSYFSGIDQQIKNQIFFNNCSTITQPITQTNTELISNLEYVQNYFNNKMLNYLNINNPNFSGLMTGNNINLSNSLSVPTIKNITNFTKNPTINNFKIEYDIIGEIKMCINEIPPNYLLCDGSSYLIADYPNLYSSIGITYGGTASTFNVPNFQSLFPIGSNNNFLGCATSNFAYGNNTSGGNNTFKTSYTVENLLLQTVPPHTHNLLPLVHSHFLNLQIDKNVYFYNDVELNVPLVQEPPPSPINPPIKTTTSFSNVSVENSGLEIQETDETSNLNGVNISPPYISVKYCICYLTN